jgi:hypothetical protein
MSRAIELDYPAWSVIETSFRRGTPGKFDTSLRGLLPSRHQGLDRE